MNTVSLVLVNIICLGVGVMIGTIVAQGVVKYAMQQWKAAVDLLRNSYQSGQKDGALEIHKLFGDRFRNVSVQGRSGEEVATIFTSKLRGVMYEFASRNNLPTIIDDIRTYEKNSGKGSHIKSPIQPMPPHDQV